MQRSLHPQISRTLLYQSSLTGLLTRFVLPKSICQPQQEDIVFFINLFTDVTRQPVVILIRLNIGGGDCVYSLPNAIAKELKRSISIAASFLDIWV